MTRLCFTSLICRQYARLLPGGLRPKVSNCCDNATLGIKPREYPKKDNTVQFTGSLEKVEQRRDSRFSKFIFVYSYNLPLCGNS